MSCGRGGMGGGEAGTPSQSQKPSPARQSEDRAAVWLWRSCITSLGFPELPPRRKTGTPEGSFQFRPKWNLDCEIAFLCGDCMAFILKSIHPSAALLPLDKSLRIRPYPSLPQLEGGPQILERGRAVPFLSKLTASPV